MIIGDLTLWKGEGSIMSSAAQQLQPQKGGWEDGRIGGKSNGCKHLLYIDLEEML